MTFATIHIHGVSKKVRDRPTDKHPGTNITEINYISTPKGTSDAETLN